MTTILAVADETNEALSVAKIRELAPDLVLSCGDLPFDYLEYIVTVANAPLLYVPGNHDPSLKRDLQFAVPAQGFSFDEAWKPPPGPGGCINLDLRLYEAAGLVIAGLGGSVRYRPGPNQYSQREMSLRVARLEARWLRRRLRGRKTVDVVITHSPPLGIGDRDDGPHRGFRAFHRMIRRMQPRLMLHGHIHPHGFQQPEHAVGDTRILNVVPYRLVEVGNGGGQA